MRRESILVGHSLEKDLHVLQLLHERVVDSAVLYDLSGEGVYKAKLRHLAARFLDRSIQTDQSGAVTPGGGHDPAEDALAALDLALLKRVEGLKFGSVPLYPASRNLIARAAQRQPSVATAVLASSTVCAPLHPFARCIVVNDDDAAVRRLAPSAADAGAAKGAKLIVMESREVEMRLAAQSWSQLPPSGLSDAESARTIVRRAVASVCNMVAAALNVVEVNSVVLLVAAGVREKSSAECGVGSEIVRC